MMLNELATLIRRAQRAVVRNAVLGQVDGVFDGRVVGWVFRPSAPSQPIRLTLLIDGRRVADVLAEGYRPDVQGSGIGGGACGFSFRLPSHFMDNAEHLIDVIELRSGRRLAGLDSRRVKLFKPGSQSAHQRLFDSAYYWAQAGDVREPLDHFRTIGWKRGYQPHPLFNTQWYVSRHELGDHRDPLSHYENVGARAGFSPHPLFDPSGHASLVGVPTVTAAEYLSRSGACAPDPSSFFSDVDYDRRYPGVTAAGFLPLPHYLQYGWQEGKRPHQDFDPALFGRLAALDVDVDPYTQFVTSLANPPTLQEVAVTPRVSIIVLNYNKAILTLQCLYFLHKFTPFGVAEIIIVDNGSNAADFNLLCRFARCREIVRINVNRGFGEGNNIGVEYARGEFVVFLNNDAFVSQDWLEPLLRDMDGNEDVGAVGGKLLFADGSLQEAGCMISSCGSALQRGKHLDPQSDLFNLSETVDYCSAAMLMVRKDAFHSVLGFDLCWDPAYYEDADLCMKLRKAGWRTIYEPASEIVHLEHGTSDVPGMRDTLRNVMVVNRLTYVQRWNSTRTGEFGRQPHVVEAVVRPSEPQEGSLALYTPYPLTPGGGERYLLTMASTFGRRRRCTLFTPDRYSRIRLLTIARDLGLNLDHVEVDLISNAAVHERHDVFVCMGNEALPPISGIGQLNLYHCQFPFSMSVDQYQARWNTLETYAGVIVNSGFSAKHYSDALRRLGLKSPPVEVLNPPVPVVRPREIAGECDRTIRILSVGRFAPDGHCKRQDLMISAFTRLLGQVQQPIELHLAGSVGVQQEAGRHLVELIAAARGLPITLYPNASAHQIAELYERADIYWHLTGADQDVAAHPELLEHFGISIVEAMSTGTPPICLDEAGPAEIVTNGVDGVLLSHYGQIVEETAGLIRDPARRARLGAAASRRAADFSPERFGARLSEIVRKIDTNGLASFGSRPIALAAE